VEEIWTLIRFRDVFELIKFEHTVFDLPFVWSGAVIASAGNYDPIKFILITLAAIFARATAMTLNRIIGRKYDLINPRKKGWPLVTGALKTSTAVQLTIIFAALFEISAFLINRFVLYLSPVVLVLFLSDPVLKKYTPWRHFYMGSIIGIGVLGGYVSILPGIPTTPEIYIVFVAASLWISGFDIIYTIPDRETDEKNGLKTLVTRYGIGKSVTMSSVVHFFTALAFVSLVLYIHSIFYYIILAVILFLIIIQHLTLKPDDPKSIRFSFLGANSFIGFLFLISLIIYYIHLG
jgi:4-hydroxybenzoate polyprenyltransferase